MKRIRERVAGLDVHRDTVVACCQVKQPDRSIEVTKQSFATTANGLSELAAWLSDVGVDTVAMEATGVYWKTGLLLPRRAVRRAVALQRTAREERAGAQDRPL